MFILLLCVFGPGGDNPMNKLPEFPLFCTEETSKQLVSAWSTHNSTPEYWLVFFIHLHMMSRCTVKWFLPACSATTRRHLQSSGN